ncbi:MAG: bifunctional aldolase/short-chain dehydrogenase [Deltaproteobacteria bacterium]|nr:bifunctional aldolase/short-chain dehydrogenase [Deltaproteobacteria bacterium]
MKSLWDDREAAFFQDDELGLRVYSARLLGARPDLVLHGGGNSSLKARIRDFLGRELEALFVKGSGWDMKTIEKPGFPAVRLEDARLLAELDELSDPDMTRQLRAALLDPGAPSPSVEAILHAILPARFVDHTHADAVVTLTNNPDQERIVREVYPDCLVLPFVMPGFVLSKQVHHAMGGLDLDRIKGIILLHHGVFTWGDDARTAYENMIELVTRAEDYIEENGTADAVRASHGVDLFDLARIRRAVSRVRGTAQLAILDRSPDAQGYASRSDVDEIACRGPITPDHVIRTKRIPVILPKRTGEGVPEVEAFGETYRGYFERNRTEGLRMLDAAPRAGIWRETGTLAFGSSIEECGIITDLARHTRWAVQTGETLGGWQALSEAEIFELEYWSLEQAKLGRGARPGPHQGKIAVVTGAASGIGRATAAALAEDGAAVVGLDRHPGVREQFGDDGIICDVTDAPAVAEAIERIVERYGGLDIAVCNAGLFQSGELLEAQSDELWDRTIAVNLTATQRFLKAAIPYLKLGVDPSILIVGSRNYAAPGPGAGAYSVSKAGVTQLARVAALELAAAGVRVNVVHPDAVFDTGAWTQDALARSAARYDMTIDAYKKKNLMKTEIRAVDVGRLLSAMASDVFRATTGAQIPVDGGNDRVI